MQREIKLRMKNKQNAPLCGISAMCDLFRADRSNNFL